MTRYPTEEELDQIRNWDSHDFPAMMTFVESIWTYGYPQFRRVRNRYYLSTGGWGGNEDIVNAMLDNSMFRMLCYESWRRGGHYVFIVKKR